MNHILVGALIISGVAYLRWNMTLFTRFSLYCESVAEATGRQSGRRSAGSDDGGLNLFDRAQFFELMRGDYAGLGDQRILAEGQTLTRQFWLCYAVGALLLVALVLICGP